MNIVKYKRYSSFSNKSFHRTATAAGELCVMNKKMDENMKITTIILFIFFASTAQAKGFPDRSEMSTPSMAKCSAAALKIEMNLWKKWYSATKTRYSIIYKDKSEKELEAYTLERIMDKKNALKRDGIDSKRAYKNYFENNCAGELK